MPFRADGQVVYNEMGLGASKAKQGGGICTCMGKRPCHAKKKEAHLCGLQYQSTMQDRMATVKAVIVLAACMQVARSGPQQWPAHP